MSAANLARALGVTRSTGGRFMCRCPLHVDRTASLSIRDGSRGPLLTCFAGCTREALIVEFKRMGIWQRSAEPVHPELLRRQRERDAADERERLERARRLWAESKPAAGTVVEVYLRARGLRLPNGVPASLRFRPALRHKPSDSTWPAMVAQVVDIHGAMVGVHRTWIDRNGQRKAPISPAKMALGPTGRGVVKLGPDSGRLVIGEGIETTLAATELTGGAFTPWAALNAGTLRRKIEVPRSVKQVLIAADHDPSGEGFRAARTAAARLFTNSRRVEILAPRTEGRDFADLALARAGIAHG